MQNKENDTDKLFRDKLLNHEVVPPARVWDDLVKSMDEKNRRRRMIWIIGFSSAASLLLAFLSGWYFAGKLPVESNLQAIDIQKEMNVPSQVAPSVAPVQTSTQNNNLYADNQLFQPSEKLKSPARSVSIPAKSQSENIFVRLLSSVDPGLISSAGSSYELIAMNSDGFSASDRAIIAQNTSLIKESSKEKNQSSWEVGVQASPVYRFDQGSTSKDFASDPLLGIGSVNGSSNYVTNVSGGLRCEYHTGSRLSVQSGVNYGEVAQNPGMVGVSFAGQNWITDRYNFSGEKVGSNNAVNSLSNNMILKTQMGLANIAMPEGTDLATVDVSNSFTANAAKNYNLEQRAGYLEIPLVVRYKIIDRRIGFLVLGGINTNFLMSNNVSLVDNKEVIANGKIEGLNPLTFSSSIGMGVNYAISRRFNLSLEPTMKVQLNSLNKQTTYNSKPYTVGVFTGISYQF